MTRQPAIDVGILFIVTFQAHSHAPFLVRQPLNIFNQPVALPAGNFTVDVSLMIEQDMLGHIIHLNPGRGGLGVEILVLFLDPGMFFYNIVVAVQTLFHRRDTRKVRVSDVRVTVLALNLFDATVNIVAEGNRLLRAEIASRPDPKYINEACGCQYGNQGQKNNCRIFSQRSIPCQKAT